MEFFLSPEIKATKILDTYVHQKYFSRAMKGT